MKFVKGRGFFPDDELRPIKTVQQVIEGILEANPNRNQTEIVRLAHAVGCSQRQIKDCLRTGPWSRRPGPKNSTLFSLPTEPGDDDE